ncbi:hypothetical protein [Niallia sp. BSM11]|uniref:hypothetical protein n=1 Tax=Niallia sp. BSM11 TaxID=3391576 RepID=UPI0039856AB8
MRKIPNLLKIMVILGLLLIIISVSLLSEHPSYQWIRWTGNILLLLGIISIPFSKVTQNGK